MAGFVLVYLVKDISFLIVGYQFSTQAYMDIIDQTPQLFDCLTLPEIDKQRHSFRLLVTKSRLVVSPIQITSNSPCRQENFPFIDGLVEIPD